MTVTRSGDQLIAVKQVGPQRVGEIEREAELLRRLDHPGLVRYLNLVTLADGGKALHTEFVSSDTWATRPIADPTERARAMAALAAVVADLHDLNVAHLRLFAGHILHGSGDRPILCGLTRASEASDHSRQIDLAALAELCHDAKLDRGPMAGKLASLADDLRAGRLNARELARRLDQLLAKRAHRSRLRPRRRGSKQDSSDPMIPSAGRPVAGGSSAAPSDPPGGVQPGARADGIAAGADGGSSRGRPGAGRAVPSPKPRSVVTPQRVILAAVALTVLAAGWLAVARWRDAEPPAGDGPLHALAPAATDAAGPVAVPANTDTAERADRNDRPARLGDNAGSGRQAPAAVDPANSAAGTSTGDSASPGRQPSAGGDPGTLDRAASSLSGSSAIASKDSPDVVDASVIVEHAGRRYAIGVAGDLVAQGDWDCDGEPTPAIVRPATGDVVLFDRWPGPDETVVMPVTRRVEQPTGVEVVTQGSCDLLRVFTPTGSRLIDPRRIP